MEEIKLSQLRKRNRTPNISKISSNKIEENNDNQELLKAKFNFYKNKISEIFPCANYDKFHLSDNNLECQLNGFSVDLKYLISLETEEFKYYIEDGFLVLRYIEKIEDKKLNKKYYLFIIWIIFLFSNIIYIYSNFENYKKILY